MNASFKPYLMRAFYEWVLDEGWTPHIAVVIDEQTRVPAAYIKDGQIVLNIGPNACREFFIHNDGIAFEARFNGAVHSIWVPIGRVLSIFARESEEGFSFEITETLQSQPDVPAEVPKAPKRPVLKVVK